MSERIDTTPLPAAGVTILSDLVARTATRHLLFTGKGGVGKTTVAAATAVALADQGRQVLLVSTDPASNLDEVLATAVGQDPTPVPRVAGLAAMNIDPEAAAARYRERTLAPYRQAVPAAELASMEEQLSGQCTVEVAAFDQFSVLLASPDATARFDHVVFDTAPTGHTLRLLSLPAAWNTYLQNTPAAASCLGPLSTLDDKRDLYADTIAALRDPERTTLVLVSRPDRSALHEAARVAEELAALGVANQRLVVNGVLSHPLAGDPVAVRFAERQRADLAAAPPELATTPTTVVGLVASDLTGIDALRAFLRGGAAPEPPESGIAEPSTPGIGQLIDQLETAGNGVVMVMGKGGVGKTTVAAAVAVGLARRGHDVHLATTDPAGRFTDALGDRPPPNLTVSRIDPAAEVRRYVDARLRAAADLDPARRALLEEDLRSPCTEELAVFGGFSRLLSEGRNRIMVVDTAPSGHTLLLLDRTGSYHRDVMRGTTTFAGRVTTPLMRIQDPAYTRIVIVTLPEATPVQEAADLQTELRRAGIEPYGWVINASLAPTHTRDPVLAGRARLEHRHIHHVQHDLATRTWMLPWLPETTAADVLDTHDTEP